MSKKMNTIFYLILLLATIVLEVFFVKYIWMKFKPSLASLGKEYVDMPNIYNDVQLENALKKSPKKYIFNNVEVFGTPVEDSLGLFKDKHLANIRIVFEYRSLYNNGARSYNWVPASKNLDSKADMVKIFNKYPFCWKDADFQAFLRTVNSDDINKDAKVFNTEYYDNSSEIKKKYILHKLDNGDKVSFVATVGNGEIILENFGSRKTIVVGEPSQMVMADSVGAKVKWILLLMLGLMPALFMLIFCVNKMIS